MTSHNVLRPYNLPLVHLWYPSYGAYAIPHPSYGAITAPQPLSPYHTRPQYLAYVPSTHYSLTSPQHHPVTVPIGPRQSRIPGWQRSANIPPRQNRGYIPSMQHHANIPPRQNRGYIPSMQHHANIPPRQNRGYIPSRQHHANIPPRQRRANIPPRQRQNYVSVMEGGPTALSYADRVQPQPSGEPELVIVDPPPQLLEIDDVIQGGGTPAAKHTLESLPSVIVSLDDDDADCVICFDKMCSHNDKDITKLPCNHLFHRHCIVHWLSSNNTCPICRFMLPADETVHQE